MRDRKQELLEELDLLLEEGEMGELGEVESIQDLDHYLMEDLDSKEQDLEQPMEQNSLAGESIVEESIVEETIEEEVKDSLIHVENRDVSYSDTDNTEYGFHDEIIDLDKEYEKEEPNEKKRKSPKSFLKNNGKGYGKISKNAFLEKYKNHFLYGGMLGFLVIVLLIVLISGIGSKPIQEDEKEIKNTEETQQSESMTENTNPLQMNKYDDVKELVQNYYKAVTDCDVATLANLVDDTSDVTEETLIKQKEYIESYDKIDTYVKNGITENTYVVWVYYETKLLNIDTSAPGSSVLYVKRNEEDNSVRICNSGKDKKIVEYINQLMKDQDVIDFNKNVDVKLERACAQDKDLEQFVSKINGEDESASSNQ